MGPNGDTLRSGGLFPLHFFEHGRISLFDQSAQLGQFRASPIALCLDDVADAKHPKSVPMGISHPRKDLYLFSSHRLLYSLKIFPGSYATQAEKYHRPTLDNLD
jgi:hypothetical protein